MYNCFLGIINRSSVQTPIKQAAPNLKKKERKLNHKLLTSRISKTQHFGHMFIQSFYLILKKYIIFEKLCIKLQIKHKVRDLLRLAVIIFETIKSKSNSLILLPTTLLKLTLVLYCKKKENTLK